MKFSKGVLFVLGSTVIAFTAVVFYFVWHGRYVPDVLINRFFVAFLGEAGILGAIKIAEVYVEMRKDRQESVERIVDTEGGVTTGGVFHTEEPGFSDVIWEPSEFEKVFPKNNDIL